MARQKGSIKTGGRKKGSLNRKTADLLSLLEKSKLDVPQRIIELLPTVSAEVQLDILMKLMSFLYPKRKPACDETGLNRDTIPEPRIILNIPRNGRENLN